MFKINTSPYIKKLQLLVPFFICLLLQLKSFSQSYTNELLNQDSGVTTEPQKKIYWQVIAIRKALDHFYNSFQVNTSVIKSSN